MDKKNFKKISQHIRTGIFVNTPNFQRVKRCLQKPVVYTLLQRLHMRRLNKIWQEWQFNCLANQNALKPRRRLLDKDAILLLSGVGYKLLIRLLERSSDKYVVVIAEYLDGYPHIDEIKQSCSLSCDSFDRKDLLTLLTSNE